MKIVGSKMSTDWGLQTSQTNPETLLCCRKAMDDSDAHLKSYWTSQLSLVVVVDYDGPYRPSYWTSQLSLAVVVDYDGPYRPTVTLKTSYCVLKNGSPYNQDWEHVLQRSTNFPNMSSAISLPLLILTIIYCRYKSTAVKLITLQKSHGIVRIVRFQILTAASMKIAAIYFWTLSIVLMFCNHNDSRDGSSLVIR
jgi:hypothetical protein